MDMNEQIEIVENYIQLRRNLTEQIRRHTYPSVTGLAERLKLSRVTLYKKIESSDFTVSEVLDLIKIYK